MGQMSSANGERLGPVRIDHLVLGVRDVERSARFYEVVLGMRRGSFEHGRTSMHLGDQKLNLNLQPAGASIAPADFCVVTDRPIAEVVERIEESGASISLGPVQRTGALGVMLSVYLTDPDGHTVEVASYQGSRPFVEER